MKIYFLAACTAFFFSVSLHAQQNKGTIIYPAVIQFQSECCGVPDDAPVRQFIRSFRKQQKIKKKLTAYHIGPMGKEGEYYLAFTLREMTKKQKKTFIKKLKVVTANLKDKGSASFAENLTIEREALPGRATIEKQVF